jgi:hypothetical protein
MFAGSGLMDRFLNLGFREASRDFQMPKGSHPLLS